MNESSKIYKELSYDELNKIIKSNFGVDKFEARLISGGLFNTTYRIKLLDSKREIILRVGPSNQELLLPFEHNLMLAEEKVYSILKKEDIPCSTIINCDVTREIINRNYMILEYIDSKPLSEVDLSNEIKSDIYKNLGAYVAKIHNINSNKFGRVYDVSKGNGFNLWSEYLYNEIIESKQNYINYNVFSEDEVKLFGDVILKYKEILDEIKMPHLIHADLWDGNVLIQSNEGKQEIAAIIDADRSVFGDIDFEFANPWIVNEDFIKGYGADLKDDADSEIRRKIYRMIYSIIDAYVWSIEYNNDKCGLENKDNAIKLALELITK